VLSVAYLDIDDFKLIDDEHGHAEGDRVLQAFACLAAATIRSSDRFASVGGDEFVLLMPETTSEDALSIAQRLSQVVAATGVSGEGHIGCSIGVATFEQFPGSVDELVSCADRLMYEAKESGKNALRCALIWRRCAGQRCAGRAGWTKTRGAWSSIARHGASPSHVARASAS
jgi:diguanylate cyclase (GGDEF)-like protein